MKAVVLKGSHDLEYRDVPLPELKPDEVLVRVKACGVCGSDLRYYDGESPWAMHTLGINAKNPDNIILGHEFTGEVVEVRDPKYRFLVGRRVGVLVYNTCGVCEFCRTGRENLCRDTKHIGHGAGWNDMKYFPGGMAEYCQVWGTHCYPIADHVSDEEASTLDFFAVAMHAVKLAPELLGEDVAIIGSGPVGLAIAQIVRLFGARRVYCVDIYDLALEIAAKVGADGGVNATQADPVEYIKEQTGGSGVRAVFDCVGTNGTQKQGLQMLGCSGTMVNLVANENEMDYQLLDLSGERSIRCSANNPFKDFPTTLRLMEAGRLQAKPLITHRFRLEQVKEAFELLWNKQKTNAMKVILYP
ncbi:L-iditol 2-dehydrogenase [Hydrogenispora ethanolica]|uniref:L-iditol 2-dehydrogenase n=1 Tax=Hydrogenispora ethanolica TaxID=1082276 RepID=A0A4R1S4C5_HYDET|nr:alcohol dehydrogenase catalytic domain-containing protein [Hydrogenispora ethanolica]TCL74118.1 L-iditol 2-dehydrogenase [Hydrogenispora ethanolica]